VNKDDDFKFSTDEELLKQARKDINKQLRDLKKGKSDKPKEPTAEEILQKQANDFQNEKMRIQSMTPVQIADWLIEKHDTFVETCNAMFNTNCMDCEDYNDRSLKILYINELNNLLHIFEIEEFEQETIDVLKEKNYVDLLVVLHVLGFIM